MSLTTKNKTFGIPPEEPMQYYPTLSRQKDVGNLIYDLGHYGGLHQPYRTEDLIALELNSVKAAVKLAKEVNLANRCRDGGCGLYWLCGRSKACRQKPPSTRPH